MDGNGDSSHTGGLRSPPAAAARREGRGRPRLSAPPEGLPARPVRPSPARRGAGVTERRPAACREHPPRRARAAVPPSPAFAQPRSRGVPESRVCFLMLAPVFLQCFMVRPQKASRDEHLGARRDLLASGTCLGNGAKGTFDLQRRLLLNVSLWQWQGYRVPKRSVVS